MPVNPERQPIPNRRLPRSFRSNEGGGSAFMAALKDKYDFSVAPLGPQAQRLVEADTLYSEARLLPSKVDSQDKLIAHLRKDHFLTQAAPPLAQLARQCECVGVLKTYLNAKVRRALLRILPNERDRYLFVLSETNHQLLPILKACIETNQPLPFSTLLAFPTISSSEPRYHLLEQLVLLSYELQAACPDIKEWLFGTDNLHLFPQLYDFIIKLSGGKFDTSIFNNLIYHPNIHAFIAFPEMTPEKLLAACDLPLVHGRQPYVDSKEKATLGNRVKLLHFFVYEPAFMLTALELGQSISQHQPWSAKIDKALTVIQALGLHGTTDQQMNQAILRSWFKSPGEEDLKQEYATALPSRQQQLLSTLRNMPTQKDTQFRTLLREKNARLHTVDPQEMTLLPHQQEMLSRIDQQEDERHPFRYLLPSYGDEIEAAETKFLPGPDEKYSGVRRRTRVAEPVYYLLHHLGFSLGFDNIEHAPGPFWSPETRIFLFELWTDSGLLDLHQEHEQSLHSNLGVTSERQYAALVALMQATAYAYKPTFKKKDPTNPFARHSDFSTFAIQSKNEGEYVESQDFVLLSREGYINHTRGIFHLGTALKAYEAALDSLFIDDDAVELPKTLVSSQVVDANHYLTPEQRKLAMVWVKLMTDFQSILAVIDTPKALNLSRPDSQATKFYQHIAKVIPDYWDSYNNPDEVVDLEATFVIDTLFFTNLVSAARYLVTRAQLEVKNILETAESDLAHMVKITLEHQNNPIQFRYHLETILDRFYPHITQAERKDPQFIPQLLTYLGQFCHITA